MDARASNSAGPSPNTASVRHAGPVVGHRIVLVILAGTASWPGFAATNAIVADLITEESGANPPTPRCGWHQPRLCHRAPLGGRS